MHCGCFASRPAPWRAVCHTRITLVDPCLTGDLCCRSAVETVKIARETIEGLFNLQVGLAEDTIQSLCAGIAECIAGYAQPQPHTCCCVI